MKKELDRQDLHNLVKGTYPSYESMGNNIVSRLGKFTGGIGECWDWNYSVPDDITDEQLWEVYNLCKRS